MNDSIAVILGAIWIISGLIGTHLFDTKHSPLWHLFSGLLLFPFGIFFMLIPLVGIAGGPITLILGFLIYYGKKKEAEQKAEKEWRAEQEREKYKNEEAERQRIREREANQKRLEREAYESSPEYQAKLLQEKRERAIKYLALKNPTANPSQFTDFAIQAAMEAVEKQNMVQQNAVIQDHINREQLAQQRQYEQEQLRAQAEKQQIEEKKRYYYSLLRSRIGQTIHIESSHGHYITQELLDVNSDNAVFESGIKYQPTTIPLESITFIQ